MRTRHEARRRCTARHAVSAAALAALPLQTLSRLGRLVACGDPAETFARIISGQRVIDGVDPAVWRAWESCAGLDTAMHERCAEHGISVTWHGHDSYPEALAHDLQPPPVVFYMGDLSVLGARRVGIVGTRTATLAGRNFARRLGRDLATEGHAVVSGLARGIDIHAHRGVIEAGGSPVGVVASGLDVVYPPEHRGEWGQVAAQGLLVSEEPPGAPPEVHKFPRRNRILAALSEVLVVVESRHKGGSMSTVRESIRRGRTVMAVPGSPHVEVCDGTNDLLKDGCAPVTSVDDVLTALSLESAGTGRMPDPRPRPEGHETAVLRELRGRPRTVDEIVLACGLPVFDAGVALGRLEMKGWAAESNGWWEALLD